MAVAFRTGLGAVVALAYHSSGEVLKPILAMNVGISAPLVIQSMLNGAKTRVRVKLPEGA
jgi:hypothetical protein